MRPLNDEMTILIPLFNDWEAVELLLSRLDLALEKVAGKISVLLVDDGSTRPSDPGFPGSTFSRIGMIDVLQLRRNVGHQRAIAVGLVFLYQHREDRQVVVMDGDGEDRPEDVPALIDRFRETGGETVVFAERTRRIESLSFRFFYHLYRWIHLGLTGYRVKVGNFSILPMSALSRLAASAELWNHYAAAVFRSQIPITTIPLPRGKRLSGRSRMNFIALLMHGLSAISVFGDIVAARLLTLATALAAVVLIVCAVVLSTNLRTNLWVMVTGGLIALGLLEAVMVAFLLVFMMIGSRIHASFLPIRDCPYFVAEVKTVFPRQ